MAKDIDAIDKSIADYLRRLDQAKAACVSAHAKAGEAKAALDAAQEKYEAAVKTAAEADRIKDERTEEARKALLSLIG